MTKEEILHLSHLARIELTETEVTSLQKDITSILDYVGTVQSIAGSEVEKKVGPLYNVFREDIATEAPGQHTEVILGEAPKRHKNYIEVKKILSTDD